MDNQERVRPGRGKTEKRIHSTVALATEPPRAKRPKRAQGARTKKGLARSTC